MNIDKNQIIEHLKSLGKNDEAARADSELPDKVDTDRDGGILDKFGISPSDLIGRIGGMFR